MEKGNSPALNPGQIQEKATLFENRLLNYTEAAEYLSISESYLRRLKAQGQIAYVPVGSRSVRFRIASLSRWIERKEMS